MSDDPAPENTGSAENRHQSAIARCAVCTIIFRHGQQPTCPPALSEHSPERRSELLLSMLRRLCLSTGTLNSNARSFLQREPSLLDRQSSKASTNCITIPRKS